MAPEKSSNNACAPGLSVCAYVKTLALGELKRSDWFLHTRNAAQNRQSDVY